jgi:hypothetical protein
MFGLCTESGELQECLLLCHRLLGALGVVIIFHNAFMFYWEDYKSSGFDRSNLFLLRIANPQGRLAVDFLESLGVVFR